MMSYVITCYGFFYLALGMVCLAPIGCVLAIFCLTPLKGAAGFAMYRVAQLWARSFILILGLKPKVSGRENIIKRGGLCFIANHSGIFDIVLIIAYAGRPFGFIAKKELSFIPFLNIWILLLGGLFIDRKSPRRALKTINRGVRHIEKGGSMLIFPEGTRSQGRGLLPFRQGSFKLALESALPVIPVAISGSYEIFEKNGLFSRHPLSISFGELIDTNDAADSRRGLARKTQAVIENMLKISGE